jgi:hypothetical protein
MNAREKFEAWAKGFFDYIDGAFDRATVGERGYVSDQYHYAMVQAAWSAWQARERVEPSEAAAIDFLERNGFRRCDISACNCGSWHGGHASRRLDEIKEALTDADVDLNGKTILAGVQVLAARAALSSSAPSEAPWLPTPANINALPDPIRHFIMELETRADPAGTVRENAMLKDVNRELAASNRMLRDRAEAAEKDAQRYRAIRNPPYSDQHGDLYAMCFEGDGDIVLKGDDLDAAADSAIKAAPPVKAASSPAEPSKALKAIVDERQRQIEVEGWTSEHDDEHWGMEMAFAASCYCIANEGEAPSAIWPWDWSWWKPKDHRSNLIKAGALIVAEIERLDRAALPLEPDSGAASTGEVK